MGAVDSIIHHFIVFEISTLFNDVPDIILQTMTFVCTYPFKINLDLFTQRFTANFTKPNQYYYNAESFPAFLIKAFKPMSVNVFASGKVVLMGAKNESDAYYIEDELDLMLL